MGLRDLLRSKKEVLDVDGRDIIIVNDSRIDQTLLHLIRRGILKTCAKLDVACRFPRLEFVIETRSQTGKLASDLALGWVDPEEINKGLDVVHLNSDALKEKGLGGTILFQTLTHEIVHLWHQKKSNALLDFERSISRLDKSLDKKRNILLQPSHSMKIARPSLFFLFHGLYVEGVATFHQKYCAGKIEMSEKRFERHKQKIEEESRKIKQLFNRYIVAVETDQFSDEVFHAKFLCLVSNTATYQIGLHAVYAMLFLDKDMTFEKILKMRTFGFIKRYESIMRKHGHDPVISLTSGKGILDYRRMVDQLTEAMKKSSKR